MAKKSQAKELNELEVFTRKNKRTTSIKNRGIKRANVLSSNRKLPSTKGALHLAAMVEQAHSWLKIVEKKWLERNEIITRKTIFSETFRRQPKRALEHPNNWLLDQQLSTIKAELDEAVTLYDALQAAHKRTVGQRWKPKADVNAPIDFEF